MTRTLVLEVKGRGGQEKLLNVHLRTVGLDVVRKRELIQVLF